MLVEVLEVLAELGLPVAADQGDLEELVARAEGAEARERLLAGAADADEEGVAAGHLDDAEDAREVLEGHLEEDEAHGLAVTL
jgi:hypothetical protein